MSKTFTFAGTCVENGATVYKFANDVNRAKALERFGCTDINMIALPEAMDKEAAVAYLATKGVVAGKAPRVAKAAKAAKPAKPAKAAVVKVKATKDTKVIAKDSDAALKEQWAEAMAEREADGLMPTMSFAEWKRNSAKWDKFMAKVDAKLEAKREAGKVCF